jgi:serine/threonine protein kinase/Flp pilus assembly protein TadD
MALARGTRLGPYEIVSSIGAGGMGEVYRAWDTRLERDIAIKVLAERLAYDSRSLARFQTEAKSIAALSHPNILSIYDAELEHVPLFLVTELLQGETLRQQIARLPIPWRRAVEIGCAIAEGLGAAHDANIIHRDVKPENIFLTAQGAIKILDFGLARLKPMFQDRSDSSTATASETDMFLGTVGYLAPEQARGETVTPASDIFSLGCVLYEMVSGSRAFHGPTPVSTLSAVLNRDPRPLAECVPEIPPELGRWIARCMSKNRTDRPQSVRDLGLLLSDLLSEPGATHTVPRAEFDSLAVLPFVTSASSPDAEYLADGITEALINQFAQLQHLRVIARSTVFHHKQSDVDPIELGRSLAVSSVLTGRIFQRGDVLVIAAELINVRDGRQLWGQQYKRHLTDLFSIEEEISREISERLRVRFAPGQSRLGKHYTENPEAYQLYLKGRFAWNKRTIEGMRQALTRFEQAVETDPSYARAYTGLADCTSMLSIYGELDPALANRRAKAAQEIALQSDPELSEAHASRGFRLLFFDWDFRAAERELLQALNLNSGYAPAHQWLGMAMGLTGRLEEARRAMRIAQQLDPFSASINTTAVFPVYWAHLFDEAIEGFRTAIDLHPGYWLAHYYLGLSYAQKGEFGQALLSLRLAAEIGDSAWRYAGLGYVYARAGERERAESVLRMLTELERQKYVPAIYSAAVYAGLGESDQAFTWLRRAVERRDCLIAWFHIDPLWDILRSDSRLCALQADVGLKL